MNGAIKNNMEYNGDELEFLKHGKLNNLIDLYEYIQPNCSRAIQETAVIRYLGIIISRNGYFSDHMNMITSKVKQRIGWIFRTFQTNTAQFGKFMWKSYIQGLLDYGSQIWAPVQITQIQKLELLQKSFTNRLYALQNKNYWEKLKIHKIYSVGRRFQR